MKSQKYIIKAQQPPAQVVQNVEAGNQKNTDRKK